MISALVGIVVVLVIIIGFLIFYKPETALEWENKKVYYELVDRVGEPSYVDTAKDGFAVWKQRHLTHKGYPWYKIELINENLIYHSIIFKVPEDLRHQIAKLSNNITYEQATHILRTGSENFNENILILYYITKVVEKELGVEAARRDIIATMATDGHLDYKKNIERTQSIKRSILEANASRT